MKWGERRWQNEDGSLTPEGRVHYGYGEGGQTKEGAKLEKYVTKQHERFDKFANRRQALLDHRVEKKWAKYEKKQNLKRQLKYLKALQDKYEDEEITKLMHKKIDDLDVDTWRLDRDAGRKGALAKATLGNVSLITGAVKAANRGAKGVLGGAKDIARYNNRISKEEYAEIKQKAKERAYRDTFGDNDPKKKAQEIIDTVSALKQDLNYKKRL